MAYDRLREEVWKANLALVDAGLVILTWGNVSGVDRDAGVMAIKPSGVPYDRLEAADIVVQSLEDGIVVEGHLQPSSDAPSHLLLYQRFESIGGVVHTHSTCATAWAQAGREIPALGTTHADYFYGAVPVTEPLSDNLIESRYEHEIGIAIVECLQRNGRTPQDASAVLVHHHGPFVWGTSPQDALDNARVLEEVAEIAMHTLTLNPDVGLMPQTLLDKHFLRKHGPDAYYGQKRWKALPD